VASASNASSTVVGFFAQNIAFGTVALAGISSTNPFIADYRTPCAGNFVQPIARRITHNPTTGAYRVESRIRVASNPAAACRVRVTVILRDVSDARRMQAELRASQAELRALMTEHHRVEDRERRRIARELHDELQQVLVAIKIHVASIERELAADPLWHVRRHAGVQNEGHHHQHGKHIPQELRLHRMHVQRERAHQGIEHHELEPGEGRPQQALHGRVQPSCAVPQHGCAACQRRAARSAGAGHRCTVLSW
jgi:hypothetical protein